VATGPWGPFTSSAVGPLIGLRLSKEETARLDRWAKANGYTRSEAIRVLIERGLPRDPDQKNSADLALVLGRPGHRRQGLVQRSARVTADALDALGRKDEAKGAAGAVRPHSVLARSFVTSRARPGVLGE
jgi:hypothetical protein